MKGVLAWALALLISVGSSAQTIRIGEWFDHLPYEPSMGVSNGIDNVFCGTRYAYFTYNKEFGSIFRRSKAHGLSDVGLSTLRYHMEKDILLLAYTNSNIDLIIGGNVVNMPDIFKASIVGEKLINHINFEDDYAYLSCSFGIVVIDLSKTEIKDTYKFGSSGSNIKVHATASDGTNIFASTEFGVYRASLVNGDNLLSFESWLLQGPSEGIPSKESFAVIDFNNNIYASVDDSLYILNGTNWSSVYGNAGWTFNFLSAEQSKMIGSEILDLGGQSPDSAHVIIFDTDHSFQNIMDEKLIFPVAAIEDDNGDIWISDSWKGVFRYSDGTSFRPLPNGPKTASAFDLSYDINGSLWVAPGGVNQSWVLKFNSDGVFARKNEWWQTYDQYSTPVLDETWDYMAIAAHPTKDEVYIGSYASGLLQVKGEEFTLFDKDNSILRAPSGDPLRTHVAGVVFDRDNNLWISNSGSSNPLVVLKSDGSWKAFSWFSGGFGNSNKIAIDEFNQKWIVLHRNSAGLIVYNHGTDIDDDSDDQVTAMKVGIGLGDLPTNEVRAVAVDHDGEVWVGTAEGIVVFYCPGQVFFGGCDASRILVEQDGFLGFLLETEEVNTIVVDGANRKWIGTNNGVWLMSEDGTEQIHYFNEDNSPLLSNIVRSIAIDPATGLVNFGTDNGIIAFKGTATEGPETQTDCFVYPNPVRNSYDGPIAIQGMVANSYIKITDISGALIFEAKSLGGQAIWDGRNLNGERAHTGVYLVFATDEDGKETNVCKLLIVN